MCYNPIELILVFNKDLSTSVSYRLKQYIINNRYNHTEVVLGKCDEDS